MDNAFLIPQQINEQKRRSVYSQGIKTILFKKYRIVLLYFKKLLNKAIYIRFYLTEFVYEEKKSA